MNANRTTRRLVARTVARLTVVGIVVAAFSIVSAPAHALIGGGGTWSINDITVLEGNAGTSIARFTVTFSSGGALLGSSIHWSTADGTARNPGDYTAASGTLSFGFGATTKTLDVAVRGDTFPEPDETFNVSLSGASDGTIGDAQGKATIPGRDGAPPAAFVENRTITEGTGSTTHPAITVKLTKSVGQQVIVAVATGDGTAGTGTDYGGTSGSIVFEPGTRAKSFGIPFIGDANPEPDETFFVRLNSAVNAVVGDPEATITIADDDSTPRASVADVQITEGDSGTKLMEFTIKLSRYSQQDVTVSYGTASDTAHANEDYKPKVSSVVFHPGHSIGHVNVQIIGDTRNESNERFYFKLTGATNAVIATPYSSGRILDDD